MPLSLTKVRESLYTVSEVNALVVAAEGGQAALDLAVGTEEEDFTFSQETENADGSTTGLDNQDGVVANWNSQQPQNVRVIATAVVDEGSGLGTSATDRFAVQVFHNEAPAIDSAEGLDDPDEGAVTYNIDGILIGVKGGDTIRLVAVAAEGNVLADLDIAAAGEMDLAAV